MATNHIAFATTYSGDGWHDGYTDGRADCLANQSNDPSLEEIMGHTHIMKLQ
jgi:hypothetical protein